MFVNTANEPLYRGASRFAIVLHVLLCCAAGSRARVLPAAAAAVRVRVHAVGSGPVGSGASRILEK